LHGPSRKQWDWEGQKAGEVLRSPERRASIYNGDIVPDGGNSLIYTCPTDKRAKLIYATLSAKSGEGHLEILLKGVPTFVLQTYAAGTVSFVARYEDGIDMESGDTLTIFCDATGSNEVTASAQVIEEDAAAGYTTPT